MSQAPSAWRRRYGNQNRGQGKGRGGRSEAFDVEFDDSERQKLADDWSREIEDAINARATMIADGGLIDLADWYYEQGRSAPKDRPFKGAADLTSYLVTVDVDAMRSRLMKAVFGVEPFCLVEGWGVDASKAPAVEAFHEWQVADSTLKADLGRALHGALIEDGAIIEVSEKVETRRITQTLDAKLTLNEFGQAIFTDGQAQFERDPESGDPVPAQPTEPSAKVEYTATQTKRLGPQYDVISMKDFVYLPGHARSRREVWGYAKRFWKRVPELEEQARDGVYDEDAVARLGTQSDRESVDTPAPVGEVVPQYDESVEKELFELSIKRDLDGDGRDEWYVATISIKDRELLRIKLDTFVTRVGEPRCVPILLFPRRNSVYGYSYVLHKLLTIAEEHTSLRNMRADRSAMATNKPMKRLKSALWDPDVEPWGVGETITVNTMDEVEEFQVADVPNSIVQQEQVLMRANEEIRGLADSAIGVLSTDRRTLGENRLAAGGSAIRVDEVMGHLHTAIATIMKLSHETWVDSLESETKGLEAPESVVNALAVRGTEFAGRFTPDMLKGKFRFKPYGSTMNADPQMRQENFSQGLAALSNLGKVFVGLQAVFASPAAAKAVLEEWARVFEVRDRQPFLGAFAAMGAPGLPAQAGPGAGAEPMLQDPGGASGIAQLMQMFGGGNGGAMGASPGPVNAGAVEDSGGGY